MRRIEQYRGKHGKHHQRPPTLRQKRTYYDKTVTVVRLDPHRARQKQFGFIS
jgi:hypothetical protein